MTSALSLDAAPDRGTPFVRWQPRSAAFARRDFEQKAVVAVAVAALAVLAVGAVTLAAFAAARVASGRATGPARGRGGRLRRPF